MRCAHCKNTWHAELEEENPELVPEFVDTTKPDESDKAESPDDDRAESPSDDKAESGDNKEPEDSGPERAKSEFEAAANLAEHLAKKIGAARNKSEDRANTDELKEPALDQGAEKEDLSRASEVEKDPLGHGSRNTLPALVEPRSPMLIVGWAAWAVFVVSFLFSVVFFKGELVEVWPPMGQLYDFVGLADGAGEAEEARAEVDRAAIQIRKRAESKLNPDGTLNLAVSGTISNAGSSIVELPMLRGVLLNGSGERIFEWTFTVFPDLIGPNSQMDFVTDVQSAPRETAELDIFLIWPE